MSVKIRSRDSLRFRLVERDALNFNIFALIRSHFLYQEAAVLSEELLNISVGAQSISPFYWSIRSGNLNSAKAILQDLLTIRADRDVYYFACDDLFVRHPDVVKYLMTDVPALLHTLFEGLVWRSRWISKGQHLWQITRFKSLRPCGRRFVNPSHNLDRNSEWASLLLRHHLLRSAIPRLSTSWLALLFRVESQV